jgi:hypothetical protein
MDLELPNDFKEFLRLLRARGVEYLPVGGYAVGYHGQPRFTNYLDSWLGISPKNAERVVAVVREFGFDIPELSIDLFLQPRRLVSMGVEPMRIELMTSASGVEFEPCYKQRVETLLDGVPVSLISFTDLKQNKRLAGRPKDLADLDTLEKAEND